MAYQLDSHHVFEKKRSFLIASLDFKSTTLGEKLVERELITRDQLVYIQVLIMLAFLTVKCLILPK